MSPLAKIPSPTQSVWHLAGIPIRGYALCIVAGIVAACIVTERRLRQRGAPPNTVLDIAVWAVPMGIIGARIYHVLTPPGPYFGPHGHPLDALKIWHGGLGVWGSVIGGALGAWIACRQRGIPLRVVADALAPGLPLAQAIGRIGNYLNNELYGRPTNLPWGLEIHEWGDDGRATDTNGHPTVLGVYHPTFLYELLWDLGVALLVWRLDKRYRFGRGRAFALYAMAYCAGRFWVELMRTDEAAHVLGLRLNVLTSVVVFAGALIYFVRVRGPQERLVVEEDGTLRAVAVDAPDTAVAGADTDPDAGSDRGGPDADGPDRRPEPAGDAATAAAGGDGTPEATARPGSVP